MRCITHQLMCKRNEDKRDIHVVELMLYALFQDKRENKKT